MREVFLARAAGRLDNFLCFTTTAWTAYRLTLLAALERCAQRRQTSPSAITILLSIEIILQGALLSYMALEHA